MKKIPSVCLGAIAIGRETDNGNIDTFKVNILFLYSLLDPRKKEWLALDLKRINVCA